MQKGDTSGPQPNASAQEDLTRRAEVAVVGAGPAGATAALHLARRGRDVLLVDRHDFPRDKACGDGLIPDTLEACRRAGVYDEVVRRGRRVTRADIFSPSRHGFGVEGEYVVLKRHEFDALLVEAALAEGARFMRGKASTIETGSSGVRIGLGKDAGSVEAGYAVLATGADTSLVESLHAVERKAPSAVAIRRYVRSTHDVDSLVVSYDHSILPGYAWIFPTGDGECNVGCGVAYSRPDAEEVDLRAALERFLDGFPQARDLMENATENGPVRGARLRCGLGGVRPRAAERVLAAGETLGTTFPFTGEGIGKAMETGEAASQVLDEALAHRDPGRLSQYPNQIEALRPKYLGYELAERWLARPFLNDLLARRVSRSAYLQDQLSGIINETADPAAVFSFRGLVRSLVS